MVESREAMRDRVCLVTGATGGIGEEIARGLAERGATTVVVGRNPSRGAATLERLKRQTGNAAGEFLLADLSEQEQVRRVAAEFRARYGELHVLVHNVGAIYYQRQETADGLEKTFALNHLAPFLLTNLLLDNLVASAPARLIVLSSEAHRYAKLYFDDLQLRRGYSAFKAYGQSKLANILFTRELARRLAGTGVTVNVLHPGLVRSNFGREGGGRMGMIQRFLGRYFGITTRAGADTALYLASSSAVEGVSGEYFVKRRTKRSAPISYSEAAARRLWQASEELTGLAVPV